MHANTGIVVCTMLLALAGVDQVFSAATEPRATAVYGVTALRGTVPEDATTWRREPFKSPETLRHTTGQSIRQSSPGMTSDLELQGIMKSSRHFYAIMSGRTVRPGDQIDGWTIDSISRHRVILHRKDEKQIHDIYQGRIDRGSR